MEGFSKTEMNVCKNMIKDLYEKQLKHVIEMVHKIFTFFFSFLYFLNSSSDVNLLRFFFQVEKKMSMQTELLKKQLDDERIARKRTEQEFQNQLIAEKIQRIRVEENGNERKIEFEMTSKQYI